MTRVFLFLALLLPNLAALAPASGSSAPASEDPGPPVILLVTGAAGEKQFGERFSEWARRWEETARRAGANVVRIGPRSAEEGAIDAAAEGHQPDREQLRMALAAESPDGKQELWVVLIGHGTFDGREARFNARGPDFTATELAAWMKPIRRPTVVINSTSASAPFLNALSGSNRVIITATRSGHEQNFARFGGFFADAIGSLDADLDKDGQTSVLEAFLMAARRTTEFYQDARRLATEHALVDDTGDAMGTPADWFEGVRAVKRTSQGAPADGLRAHQIHLVRSPEEQNLPFALRERRDALEMEIEKLRDKKSGMKEDEYYRELETLLISFARLYQTGIEE